MGHHSVVEGMIKEMEFSYDVGKVKELITALQNLQQTNNSTSLNEVYVHFIALKLLRYFLERDRDQWAASGEAMVSFLLQYGKYICTVRNTQNSLFPAKSEICCDTTVKKPHIMWRPVIHELSTTMAIVLKLQCVSNSNESSLAAPHEAFNVPRVVQGLLGILEKAKTNEDSSSPEKPFRESAIVLARVITQRTIEEFGLFDLYSRRRGVSSKEHVCCRKRMESEGLLPLIEYLSNSLWQPSPYETIDTLAATVSALHSALLWFKYRFVDEEEVIEEETADLYQVRWEQWGSLLVGNAQQMDGTPNTTLSSLVQVLVHQFEAFQCSLSMSTQSTPQGFCAHPSLSHNLLGSAAPEEVKGREHLPELLISMVRCIRCLCSYSLMGVSHEIECEFVFQHFGVCLRVLNHSLSLFSEPSAFLASPCSFGLAEKMKLYENVLPVIINGIRRLVVNFTDTVACCTTFEPLLAELSRCTSMMWAIPGEEMEIDTYWGSVDDLLSCWLTLVTRIEHSSSDGVLGCQQVLASSTGKIFETFLSVAQTPVQLSNLPKMFSEEDGSEHIRTIESNCFKLIGRIGRLSVKDSCMFLQIAMSQLGSQLLQLVGEGGPPSLSLGASDVMGKDEVFPALRKAICMLCHVLMSFVGDPSEGEQPCIPSCFLDLQVAENHVIPLVQSVLDLYTRVLSVSPIFRSWKDVMDAYVALLERYVRVYLDAEESNAIYAQSFSGGADLVSFCVSVCSCYWLDYPAGASVAVIQLLSTVIEKSSRFRKEVMNLAGFQSLIVVVKEDQRTLEARSRGRLLACIASCVSPTDVFSCIPDLFTLLSQHAISEDVIYSANCLIGMVQFLHSSHALQSQYSSFFSLALSTVKEVFSTKLEVRLCVLLALQLSRELFTSFSVALDDDGVASVLQLLSYCMEKCMMSLQISSSWYDTPEGLQDRYELLHTLAILLYDIALWKSLDCFLADEEVKELEKTSINALAFLFENVTPEERKMPLLDSALCTALEHSCSAFTTSFVQHPQSSHFMNAILYTVQHENPGIQLVGIRVISVVEAYFSRNAPSFNGEQNNNEDVFSTFFDILLHAVVHHRTSYRNRKRLAGVLLKIAQNVSRERISILFQKVFDEDSAYFKTLQQLYQGLEYTAEHFRGDDNFKAALKYFEDIVENSLIPLDAFSITSS